VLVSWWIRWREVLSGAFGVQESVIDRAQPLGDPFGQDLNERLVGAKNRHP
jgi:hypothetical protein